MIGIFKKLFKKEKITKKYKNGDTYVGEMKNDKPHGQGTYTWPNGEKYVGVFKNDKKHGHGTWTLKDIKYVGEWKEDKMHGLGTTTSNAIKFIGKFKDNERLQGTHTWISGEFAGDKYVGDFEGDEQHGQGAYTWADGSKYVGEYKDGKMHGQGTYTSNEIKFIGKLKDDEMMQGTHTWISGESAGDKYVGEFKDGEMHGQGTYTWSDGSKYVGEYKDGEQCEGTIRKIKPKFDMISHIEPFVKKMIYKSTSPTKIMRDIYDSGLDYAHLICELPGEIRELLDQIKNKTFKLQFEHKGLEPMLDKLDNITNRLSFSVITAALVIGSSLLLKTRVPPTIYGVSGIGILVFMFSALMGGLLLISIIRHGRM